jgi:hypothetical protein
LISRTNILASQEVARHMRDAGDAGPLDATNIDRDRGAEHHQPDALGHATQRHATLRHAGQDAHASASDNSSIQSRIFIARS